MRGHEATVRAAVDAIVATVNAQLADLDVETIVLTRDEALLTVGLVSSLPELLDRDPVQPNR